MSLLLSKYTSEKFINNELILVVMKQYCIAGVNIELDTEKTYFDFYIQGGEPKLVEVGLESICKSLQSGEIPVDDDFNCNYFDCEKLT